MYVYANANTTFFDYSRFIPGTSSGELHQPCMSCGLPNPSGRRVGACTISPDSPTPPRSRDT